MPRLVCQAILKEERPGQLLEVYMARLLLLWRTTSIAISDEVFREAGEGCLLQRLQERKLLLGEMTLREERKRERGRGMQGRGEVKELRREMMQRREKKSE